MHTRQITQWIWYVNIAVAVVAVLVLLFGLSSLKGADVMATEASQKDNRGEGDGKEAEVEGTERDSPLVATVKEYIERKYGPKEEPQPPKMAAQDPEPELPKLEFTPPEPDKPDQSPEPTPPPARPEPPKPPTKPQPEEPKPEPKPPRRPPTFAVESTMVFDKFFGLAWVIEPGSPKKKQVTVGDMVQEDYEVTTIGDGYVEVERDGYTYTVEMPAPVKPAPNTTPGQADGTKPTPERPQRPFPLRQPNSSRR